MLSQEDALRAYAAMMNTQDIDLISPLLADDFHYASQWVFEEIESKQAYLDYIAPKLLSLKTSGSKVWAEMASLEQEMPGPCVVLAQGSKANLVSLVLVEVVNDKIIRLDMCGAPSPHSARRSGEYPGMQNADEKRASTQSNNAAKTDRQTFNRFVNDLHSGQSIEQMSPAMRQWWRDRY
jgi:hypothetical protein